MIPATNTHAISLSRPAENPESKLAPYILRIALIRVMLDVPKKTSGKYT